MLLHKYRLRDSRGEHEDGRNLKEGLQKLPRRKGELDGDPEKTTENLLQSRKLIKIVDLEKRMEVPTV